MVRHLGTLRRGRQGELRDSDEVITDNYCLVRRLPLGSAFRQRVRLFCENGGEPSRAVLSFRETHAGPWI